MSITESTLSSKENISLEVKQVTLETTEPQSFNIYPAEFLGFLAGRLESTIKNLFALYKVPKEASEALDNLQYLQILLHSDPEAWRPGGRKGYERDLRESVEETIRKIADLDNLASRFLQNIGEKFSECEALYNSGPSGWRE